MSAAGGEEKILVSVRVRPLNEKEKTRNDRCDWECINNTTIICNAHNLSDKPSFTFGKNKNKKKKTLKITNYTNILVTTIINHISMCYRQGVWI